jgi:hypothetical protein
MDNVASTAIGALNPLDNSVPLRERLLEMFRHSEGWMTPGGIAARFQVRASEIAEDLAALVLEGQVVVAGDKVPLFKFSGSATALPKDPLPPAYVGNPGCRRKPRPASQAFRINSPAPPGEPIMPRKSDTGERVLAALAQGPMRNAEIVKRLEVTDQTASYQLLRLEKLGKIEHEDPADRRSAWKLADPSKVPAATPREAKSRKAPAEHGGLNGLKHAFGELAAKIKGSAHIEIADLKRKRAALAELQKLLPSEIAQVLGAIDSDLARAAGVS